MEQLELVRLLVEQLRTFRRKFKFLRIKGRKELKKEYENFFDKSEKLLKYCEKVKKKQASCSEIYHNEMLNIYEAFERFKSNTNGYSALNTMSLDEISSQLRLLEDLLNASDFYLNFAVIKILLKGASEAEKAEVKRYVDKGRILKDSPLTLKLKEELSKLKFVDNLPSFYSALVGPSFLGKTQTAFTLSHLMDVFYVNFTCMYHYDGTIDQRIYRALKPLSSVIFEAVCNDMDSTENIRGHRGKKIEPGSKFFNKHKADFKFQTLGLIYTLLMWKKYHEESFKNPENWFLSFADISHVVFQPLTQATFKEKIQSKSIMSIFCIY